MATLLELRTAVRLRVQDPDSIRWTNAQVNDPINQALKEMSTTLRTFVKRATIAIVAGTREVDVVDFLEMIRLVRGDGYPIFGPVDYNTLKFNRDTTGSEPVCWYRLGNTIGFYPEASTNYNITMDYIANAPPLLGDSDVPDTSLGPYAEMYIVARATQELLLADPDFDAAERYGDLAIKYLIDAQSNRNQSNNTRGPVINDSRGVSTWPAYL